jgi:hypothetical protein
MEARPLTHWKSMTDSASPLDDLLRAFVVLGPKDEQTMWGISRIMGVEPPEFEPPPASTATDEPIKPAKTTTTREEAPPELKQPEESSRQPEPVPSTFEEINVAKAAPPDWVDSVQGLPRERRTTPGVATLYPLYRRKWGRAIASSLFSIQSPAAEIDMPEVIARIARLQPLDSLPRLRHPVIAPEIQILLDVGPSMEPYIKDQTHFVREAARVAGRDRISVHTFTGHPDWGIDAARTGEPAPYSTPSLETVIVILSDIGMGRTGNVLYQADTRDWIQFSKRLARHHCHLVLCTPYPPDRWPAGLSREVDIVQWDREVTVSHIRQRLAGRGQ